MSIGLVLGATVIICCIFLNKFTSKTGVPMLVIFILLGMLFGSEGILKIQFDNYKFAEDICSAALIFIIFYGGFGVKWSEAKKVAPVSILLSSAGVLITAFLTGMFCFLVLNMELLESLLIGSVLSSTDAASVFSVLRSKRLNLKSHTASVLELESGSNDPWAYMLTLVILSIMNGDVSAGDVAYILFAQIVYGIGIGVLISVLSVLIIKNVKFDIAGFNTLFVMAVAALSYALPTLIGGNGYISTYIAGIVLGNTRINDKPELVSFFDGITGFSQILIFFLLGLLATPSAMFPVLLPALIILVFLTVIARPAAVFLTMLPFRAKLNQQLLISFSGLRGATSIVFAIIAIVNTDYTGGDLFHIVFCTVLISIAVQGSFLPRIAKSLDMIDNNENVMKTFNDYSDETQVQFVRLSIKEGSRWANMPIKDIPFPTGLLVVMILRDNEKIVPSGKTVILAGDVVVMGAEGFYDDTNLELNEYTISDNHKWRNKRISEITIPNNGLIILIKRNGSILVPNGKSILRKNDILVVTAGSQKIKI